jgi:membrane protease YdiL (CAAX protease family)
VWLADPAIRNAAESVVKAPLQVFGKNGLLAFNLLVVGVGIAAVVQARRRDELNVSIFLPMFLESLLYALLLGQVIIGLLRLLFPSLVRMMASLDVVTTFLLAIGAGVYEEIVFRFFLLTALLFVLTRVMELRKAWAYAASILVAAAIFSLMHFVGRSVSASFNMGGFLFRFTAGLMLSAIYVFRGLGIAVYTHTLYDLMVYLGHSG